MSDLNTENTATWSKWNPLEAIGESVRNAVNHSSKLPPPSIPILKQKSFIPELDSPKTQFPFRLIKSAQSPAGIIIEGLLPSDEAVYESSYPKNDYFVPISNLISQLLTELSQKTDLSEEEILKRAVVLFAAAQKAESEGNHLAVVDIENNVLAEISAIES